MSFDAAPPAHSPRAVIVFFDRPELDRLLRLYGRMVAAGEWRDYAIDGQREAATFSVFRRSGRRRFIESRSGQPWRGGRGYGR